MGLQCNHIFLVNNYTPPHVVNIQPRHGEDHVFLLFGSFSRCHHEDGDYLSNLTVSYNSGGFLPIHTPPAVGGYVCIVNAGKCVVNELGLILSHDIFSLRTILSQRFRGHLSRIS